MPQLPYSGEFFVWQMNCFPCRTVGVMKIALPYSMVPVQSFSLCFVMTGFAAYSIIYTHVYSDEKSSDFPKQGANRTCATKWPEHVVWKRINDTKKEKERNKQINKNEHKSVNLIFESINGWRTCKIRGTDQKSNFYENSDVKLLERVHKYRRIFVF